MNKQRERVYKIRREILFADNDFLREKINEALEKENADKSKLEKKIEEFGEEQFFQVSKNIFLRVTDMLWINHLEEMDYMRSSVGLRGYGNRDPLIEYKNEAIRLFKDLEKSMNATFVKLILNAQKAPVVQNQNPAFRNSKSARPKVGRNDPCPCGSGKKYKKCHGA